MKVQARRTATRAGRVAASAARAAAKAGLTAAAVAGVREFKKTVQHERRKAQLKKVGVAALVVGAVTAAGLAARKYL